MIVSIEIFKLTCLIWQKKTFLTAIIFERKREDEEKTNAKQILLNNFSIQKSMLQYFAIIWYCFPPTPFHYDIMIFRRKSNWLKMMVPHKSHFGKNLAGFYSVKSPSVRKLLSRTVNNDSSSFIPPPFHKNETQCISHQTTTFKKRTFLYFFDTAPRSSILLVPCPPLQTWALIGYFDFANSQLGCPGLYLHY